MKVQILENIRELQAYVESKSGRNIEVKFTSTVVGDTKDANGNKTFEIVDRFLVIES